jgi:hypothetical protein
MYTMDESTWVLCEQVPNEAGWYEVTRFCEDGTPYKVQCKKLYWCVSGWFYDEDCCVPAAMNSENQDSWLSKNRPFM